MSQCEICKEPIADGYKYCRACNAKYQETQVNKEILHELRLINNNLAHIRAEVCNDESLKKSLSQPPKIKSAKVAAGRKN